MRKTVAALVLLAAMVGLSAGAPPATASTKWLCKPGLAENPCAESIATVSVRPDGSTAPLRSARKRRRPVDCFYVYPTVSLQQTPNADLTIDPEVREIAEIQPMPSPEPGHRLVFSRELASFTRSVTASADGASRLEYNKGRGIILVGHSQGTGHLGRLIRETVDRKPNLRKRLVSAMLIGGNVYVPRGKRVGGQFQNIPTCRTAVETGCLIAFSSFTSPPPADAIFGRIGGALSTPGIDPDKYEVACVNPAALDGSKGALKSFYSTNPFPGLYGLLLPDLSAWGSPWISVTGQYRASCRKEDGAHWLQFDFIGGEDDVRPRITEPLGRTWGSHLTEVNDASGNLTSVAASEIRSYLKKQKAASKKR